jgi:hypothetical protein
MREVRLDPGGEQLNVRAVEESAQHNRPVRLKGLDL